MKAWILAARPKTLPAAVVPVWVGSAPALLDGSSQTGNWFWFFLTLASCLCIQIATNLFNDAIDASKGSDTEQRLGPTRVTASGMISRRGVMVGALVVCLVAALLAIPLVAARGWPVVWIGLVSLFFSYGYTGGPFPLAYRGMGELFVILFFGFVAVAGSHLIQAGEWGGWPILLLGLQCGLYSSVLIAINNLRDVDEDKTTGKKTLAVRWGKNFARWEILLFCWLPLGCFTPLILSPMQWLWVLPLVATAAVISCAVFRHEPGRIYNRFLALGALQLILYGGVVAVLLLTR